MANLTAGVNSLLGQPANKKQKISIGSAVLEVEIADNDQARIKGLSGRAGLAENEGMLFIFPAPDFYGFWMKEMKFPLDFIWLRGDEIKDVTVNVPPPVNSALKTYRPSAKVDKVLEVNAGWAEKHNIKIGDRVEMKD